MKPQLSSGLKLTFVLHAVFSGVVGLSFLSGDHMVLIPKTMQTLREKGLENIMVIAGGIILKHQIPELKKMGVQEVFLPGTPSAEIASYIRQYMNN